MAKYHVNGEGNPGLCRAQAGGCPFGSPEEHYGSAAEARTAYEEARSVVPELHKKGINDGTGSDRLPPKAREVKSFRSRADLATFDPATMTAFLDPEARTNPIRAVNGMLQLPGNYPSLSVEEEQVASATQEAQLREIGYLCQKDEFYDDTLRRAYPETARLLDLRARIAASEEAELSEPMSPEEEEERFGLSEEPRDELEGLNHEELVERIEEYEDEARREQEYQDELRRQSWSG